MLIVTIQYSDVASFGSDIKVEINPFPRDYYSLTKSFYFGYIYLPVSIETRRVEEQFNEGTGYYSFDYTDRREYNNTYRSGWGIFFGTQYEHVVAELVLSMGERKSKTITSRTYTEGVGIYVENSEDIHRSTWKNFGMKLKIGYRF